MSTQLELVTAQSEGIQVPHCLFQERRDTVERQQTQRFIVEKRDLSMKVKLLINWSIYVPTLTHGQF